jgi:FkbM family methyltransferase
MTARQPVGFFGMLRTWLGISRPTPVVYTDDRFHSQIPRDGLRVVFEVGARHGDESSALAAMLPEAIIHSFECNPMTIEACRSRLSTIANVRFHGHALGSSEESRTFYPFTSDNNPGSSSFLRRVDADRTQDALGTTIEIRTAKTVMEESGLKAVDLLCMDVQGFELEVLKGFGDRLADVRFVLMEEPSLRPDRKYLQEGSHSKYLEAPDQSAIRTFMTSNGFRELVRLPENKIEDNVLYGRA